MEGGRRRGARARWEQRPGLEAGADSGDGGDSGAGHRGKVWLRALDSGAGHPLMDELIARSSIYYIIETEVKQAVTFIHIS